MIAERSPGVEARAPYARRCQRSQRDRPYGWSENSYGRTGCGQIELENKGGYQDRMTMKLKTLLEAVSAPPPDDKIAEWIHQNDFVYTIDKLKETDHVLLHTSTDELLVQSLFVPVENLDRSTIEDHANWSWQTDTAWYWEADEFDNLTPVHPFDRDSSPLVENAVRPYFFRYSENEKLVRPSWSMDQELQDILSINYVPHLDSYGRIDKHGDVEEVIGRREFLSGKLNKSCRYIWCKREVFEAFCASFDFVLLRAFDNIRTTDSWGL